MSREQIEGPVDTENGVIAEIAARAAVPNVIDPAKLYAITVPRDSRLEITDLEPNYERVNGKPRRKTGRVALATVDSFTEFALKHYEPEQTTVWISFAHKRIVAVLNDHKPGEDGAGFGDHRAAITLEHTDAWKHWLGVQKHQTWLAQEAFADHIEEGLKMLEIAQTIQGTSKADFKSALRLRDGNVQIRYEEETQTSAGERGELLIPEEFELAIPPFVGEDPVALKARLRTRIKEGKLSLYYKVERPDDVVRFALEEIGVRLRESFTRVYLGEPR